MKQILQSLKTGETKLVDIPIPNIKDGHVLIKTTKSLVSLGTEKMLTDFGKASIIEKARQQPEKVKMVIDKIKTDGLTNTFESVKNKLDQPIPLGYCNVGKVIGIGRNVNGFKIGDRVASNGPHAEIVCVPENLTILIPDRVSDEEATFTVIGSIALQGIRLLNPTLGETVVVIGLGLIGLITAEILLANGCKVIGYDIDDSKIEIANNKGILAFNSSKIDTIQNTYSITSNVGADGVIITASAKKIDIISQAARMSRKRGKIILTGVIDLNINRSDFYEKELSFQVSCSYGPGRYDNNYELKGNDYPLPFVRWTEKRNFQTVLELISNGRLNVKDLITNIVSIDEYQKIYGNLGKMNSIASILSYDQKDESFHTVSVYEEKSSTKGDKIAIVGAGNFTSMTLLPILKKMNANLSHIVSSGGVNGTFLAKKYNIPYSSTNYESIIKEDVDLVIITTRHDLHANMVTNALKQNKHVFVEKPLALSLEELEEIDKAYKTSTGSLTVGFNRRFSPHMTKAKSIIGNSPASIIATMNAGHIPEDSWVHDMEIGGGRIIGEACHYLDLFVYLTGSLIKSVSMSALGKNPKENCDTVNIQVKLENGSLASLNYFSNGSKAYQKERIEIFSNQKILITDNFITTLGHGLDKKLKIKTKIDKGHHNQFKKLVESLNTESFGLIPYKEIINVSKASILAVESLKSNRWVEVN